MTSRDPVRNKIQNKYLIESLDKMADEDKFHLSDNDPYEDGAPTTAWDISHQEINDVLNQVIRSVIPDWLTIQYNLKSIVIEDKRRGIETTYVSWQSGTSDRIGTMRHQQNIFNREKEIAQKDKKLDEKTEVRRGEWYDIPNSRYHRYNMCFREGGVVASGLSNGTDNVPCVIDEDDFAVLGAGEYVWSRLAVAALDQDFDIENGVRIMDHIHEYYRILGREMAYAR